MTTVKRVQDLCAEFARTRNLRAQFTLAESPTTGSITLQCNVSLTKEQRNDLLFILKMGMPVWTTINLVVPAERCQLDHPICDLLDCNRQGPHWVGEYGCAASNVWVCPPGGDFVGRCMRLPNQVHKRGCGCAGDPGESERVPQWTSDERDQARFMEWFGRQNRRGRLVMSFREELAEAVELFDSVDAELRK